MEGFEDKALLDSINEAGITLHEMPADMMKQIMHDAGVSTRAGAIVFSLPVTDTAGMILRPQSEELEEEGESAEAQETADQPKAESGEQA